MDKYAPIWDSILELKILFWSVFVMAIILLILLCSSEHIDDKRITDLEHRVELLEEGR